MIANVGPLKKHMLVTSTSGIGCVALPLVRVWLIPIPDLATEVNAWDIPTRRLAPGDVFQNALKGGAVPIKLERHRKESF